MCAVNEEPIGNSRFLIFCDMLVDGFSQTFFCMSVVQTWWRFVQVWHDASEKEEKNHGQDGGKKFYLTLITCYYLLNIFVFFSTSIRTRYFKNILYSCCMKSVNKHR